MNQKQRERVAYLANLCKRTIELREQAVANKDYKKADEWNHELKSREARLRRVMAGEPEEEVLTTIVPEIYKKNHHPKGGTNS